MNPELKQKADRLIAEAEQHRDRLIAKAVADRKISADRADDYRRMYNASPETIERLLTAPVAEGGLVAGINLGGNPFPELPTAYPAEWLPEVHQGRPLHGSIDYDDVAAAIDGASQALPAPRHGAARHAPPTPPAARSPITIEP